MEHITIKDSEELNLISDKLKKDKQEIIDQILSNAEKIGYIIDDPICFGNTIVSELLEFDLYTKEGVCIYCLGTYDPEIVEWFSRLVIFGKGDCPECGGDLVSSDRNVYVNVGRDNPPEIQGYEIFDCNNNDCDYTNEYVHDFEIE